jgi:uncharacterized membrane protein YphA (DoxX/SURF4 family)
MQAWTRDDDASAPLADVTRGIARIGVGLLFLQHGLQKIFGMFGGQPVELASLMGVAGLMELVGGTLIVLGLFARPVAAILAIEMLGAYFMAHMPRGASPSRTGGSPRSCSRWRSSSSPATAPARSASTA